MKRRPCLDLDQPECSVGRPPIADYPKYTSILTPWSDLLHLDIKIPGEHSLEGETFDAEIQMLHTHVGDVGRVSSIGIPIRASSEKNSHNEEFQLLIDQFQLRYDQDQVACQQHQAQANNNLRQESPPIDQTILHSLKERQSKFQTTRFDPYSEAFMRDIFFYRYDGSLTEPPCLGITWWIMMDPMIISIDQLHQMAEILFTHVDETCQPTSVHNEQQGVNRPIFPLGEDREIRKCAPGDYVSDIDKGKNEGRKCPWRMCVMWTPLQFCSVPNAGRRFCPTTDIRSQKYWTSFEKLSDPGR